MSYRTVMKRALFMYPSTLPTPLKVSQHLFCSGSGYYWDKNGDLVEIKYKGQTKYNPKSVNRESFYHYDEEKYKEYPTLDRSRASARLRNKFNEQHCKFIEENINDILLADCTENFDLKNSSDYYQLTNISQYAPIARVPDNVKKDWAQALWDFTDWLLYNLNVNFGANSPEKEFWKNWPEHAKQSRELIKNLKLRLRVILDMATEEEEAEIADKIINEILAEEKQLNM